MTKMDLLIATHNRGKLLELNELMRDFSFNLRDLSSFDFVKTVAETGETFAENASLKAAGYARQTQVITLADDSGLEVDALAGAPGVRSARYAGDDASDAERTGKLLAALSGIEESRRTARFVSAIAIANPDGHILNVSIGVCDGRIAGAPRGSGGFGYDPIFVPNGYDQTFGELHSFVKNKISHRSRALRQVADFLRSLTVASAAG